MKVCLLTHSYPRFPNDTTAPFVESTAETLQKHGVDVTVLTPDTPKSNRTLTHRGANLQTYRYFFPRQLQMLGYSNTLVNDCELKRYVYLLAPFMFLSGIFHLFRLHRKHHFDVIHTFWLLPNGFIGAVVSKLCRVPLMVALRGSDIFISKQNPVFRTIARWTLKQATIVTSVTPTFFSDLENFGVPKEKRRLIPNGSHPCLFPAPPSSQLNALRQQMSIPEGDLIVFALGRIVLKKGFDILIQAFLFVKEKVPNVTLIIGGDGTDLERLKTLAKDLGVSDRVRFPGTISRADVPTYFHLCDIFSLPAIFDPKGNVDGCPNVILEAMACGKPVVASGISGIPVVVKDAAIGILVEEKNITQLAEALVTLLTDEAKREQFGRAGQQRILNELTWDKVIEHIKDVYQHSVKTNA
ncbi:MAG: glycosyltransferase [Candidatus Poribacteria bacterium]|nr:glycosyltransferase [Candidatus Poribacteria bacterium]